MPFHRITLVLFVEIVIFELITTMLRDMPTHPPHDFKHKLGLIEFTLLHRFIEDHKAQLLCESVHVLVEQRLHV